MNQNELTGSSKLRTTRIFAIFLFIIAPLEYLHITFLLPRIAKTSEFIVVMTYVLLAYGALAPFVLPIIKKALVLGFRSGKTKFKSPEDLWFYYFIIQGSITDAIFIFGFMIYMWSGDLTRMLYFYPIGIAWSIFNWPTSDRYEQFMNELKQP
ncbi:MAG TPA: hypothetical protein VHP63_01945 [candidate division Zixibacteria bacterium]|nr:hypothetical protein [candidate division Zixibacteria bacterium]